MCFKQVDHQNLCVSEHSNLEFLHALCSGPMLTCLLAAYFLPTSRTTPCPCCCLVLSLHRVDFLSGQYFDIRLEVHAPVNGSQANGKLPDPDFTFTVGKVNSTARSATAFFNTTEPELERWNFTWYEGVPHS